MSDAALTDSTTPRLAYWRTFAPFSGSSTNTTSPSCSCAKCVMPIVATSPSARTHSCSFEYWRLSGTVLTSFPSFCTSGSLRSPPAVSSLRSSTVKRRLHYRSGNVLSANSDAERGPHLRERRRDVRERDVPVDGRTVRATRHQPDDLAAAGDLMAMARDPAFDDQARDLPFGAFGLLRYDRVAADEVLVQLARPTEAGLDRV